MSYTTYDRGGFTYTAAKMRLDLSQEQAATSAFCFTLRSGPCMTLYDFCVGTNTCTYALAEDTNPNPCCPTETRRFWGARR